MTTYPKKLIEVALPLAAINEGSKPETENPFLKGHPRAIHNWWARTPLSVARTILFAQLIDDPGDGLPPEEALKAREKLLDFVAKLATWNATTDEDIIGQAREMIRKQFKGKMPEFWDMFGGRASIPLEAQRLGLKVTSSDLNPVAVTIQRALLEFPPQFKDRTPVHPSDENNLLMVTDWKGTTGLAEDIRWYGKWVCQNAAKRLEHLYPKGPDGREVIAWLWARTVPSPDPSYGGAYVPLARSFKLAGKKRQVWIVPTINRETYAIDFRIASDMKPDVEGTVSRKGAVCLLSKNTMHFSFVREQAKNGNMKNQMMAIVTEGNRCRVYHAPTESHIKAAGQALPDWRPDCEMPKKHRNFQPPVYGMDNLGDLFTARQLVALTGIVALIEAAHAKILTDSQGDKDYADAVTTYLTCALSRMTDYHSNLTTWNPTNENVSHLFQRQAVPMAWDFCEANPIVGKLSFSVAAEWVANSINAACPSMPVARVAQLDARKSQPKFDAAPVISTDPPYYDNISYADLADFFYVWLRLVLRKIDPQTFATLLTPKEPELIASPTRHGSLEKAENHFREGFQLVFKSIHECSNPSVPVTVYYAFKQQEDDETDEDETQRSSTGWETMLEGLVDAGFQITGTWPVRTTKKARAVALGTNALASAVVLVARQRGASAAMATRKEFSSVLRKELPAAFAALTQAGIAPVDLAQAAIGPGMAIFSRYRKVIEADGSSMSVRTALQIINQELDAHLAAQEGELDRDTSWAVAWFEQHGMSEGEFGVAENLSRAKNTAVNSLVDEAGIITARAGKVCLIPRDQMQDDWDPATDKRLTTWKVTQQLIRALDQHGERGAAALLRRLGGYGDAARDLAYRLFSICEKKNWSGEALAYNSFVLAWPELTRLAQRENPRTLF
ncbi:MAG: DUF1156 domain-containing protein [Magnetococcales bacterium]|nr:DUF1156 domain-containing protein [Magnetococcales bacterium]